MSSRLEILEQFFHDDPTDPFNIYALALEWQKQNTSKALHFYSLLLDQHPEYIPTYYQLGKFYQDLNERDKALATFQQGIDHAKRQQAMKALRELQTAYQELEFE